MKFRRTSESAQADLGEDAAELEPAVGPFDAEDIAEDGTPRVDLGSLLIAPADGQELRIQVDEASGTVQAVLLADEEGAIELRAFAAPRHGDLWSEVRPDIAAETTRRGGSVAERDGRFGVELVCSTQVQLPDGSAATQPSRVIGINGSRWMLRATLLGRPAVEPEGAERWEDAITRVGVRRGSEAMPVGEPLPVVMPAQARKIET